MEKEAMLKQAAQMLRDQKREIDELHEKIARDEKAESIVLKLIETDTLLADQVFEKLSELRTRSLEDLTLMEKAAELYGNHIAVGFGKLASLDPDTHGVNTFLDYLVNEEE